MKDMILFPEDIDGLNAVLAPLVLKAKLLLAVLINRDGRILTNQGGLEHIDIVSLAALVAGNTASTLAIANLMGETEFTTMYHQGKDKNIFIDAIEENTFLAVVFDDQTNIDRVKVFVRQFERQLKEALKAVYDKDEDSIDLDLDMGSSSFPHMPPDTAPPAATPDTSRFPQQNSFGGGFGYQQYYPPQQPMNPGSGEMPPHHDPTATPPKQPAAGEDSAYLFLQNKMKQGHERTQPQ
jgi:predicted regulator of Ras-like GTPase activity (Roadblock/LC7/MglB family)